jgi:hypothetical protein
MKYVGYVASLRQEMQRKFWSENLKGDLRIDDKN